jgi:NAD(P)-dependent dehydrogenase (short-subunit alcohol dehydrogenase family)
MAEDFTPHPHALVVGASSGLGFALARRLAKTHAVTALARRADRLEELAVDGVAIVPCDVTEFDSLAAIVGDAVADRGKLSALVYCAGLQKIKPMRGLKSDDIVSLVNVNLTAALVFAGLFANPKFSNSDATYCAISSIAGLRPEPGIVAYSVAKAGLDALIKGLARECGPRRAVGVAPGWLDTEMTQSFGQIYTEAFREELEKKSPRGIATVESVVEVVSFLLSSAAGHITGQIVAVDGGASL